MDGSATKVEAYEEGADIGYYEYDDPEPGDLHLSLLAYPDLFSDYPTPFQG